MIKRIAVIANRSNYIIWFIVVCA